MTPQDLMLTSGEVKRREGLVEAQEQRVQKLISLGADARDAEKLLRNMRRSLELMRKHAKLLASESKSALPRQEPFRTGDDRPLKRMVAAIRFVASHSAETAGSVAEYANQLDARIDAVMRATSQLTRNAHLCLDFEELVVEELLAQCGADFERYDIRGPALQLSSIEAEWIALAIHELTVNAVSFGAFGAPTGRIGLEWTISGSGDDRSVQLIWRETGVRALDVRPSKRGFGRRLIEAVLPRELGAVTAMEFRPGGVVCTIDFVARAQR